MTDKLLNRTITKMENKYNAGVKEHGGKGLEQANLTRIQYLENIQEEALDTVNYCEGEIMRIEKQFQPAKIEELIPYIDKCIENNEEGTLIYQMARLAQDAIPDKFESLKEVK